MVRRRARPAGADAISASKPMPPILMPQDLNWHETLQEAEARLSSNDPNWMFTEVWLKPMRVMRVTTLQPNERYL